MDTIKLVTYRAETAMAHVLREALPKWRQEEERRLLQSLYASEADLVLHGGAWSHRCALKTDRCLGRA